MSDAKPQQIPDGADPNVGNVEAGTDGNELVMNKHDKRKKSNENSCDEENLCESNVGVAETMSRKHIESTDFIVEDQ